MQTDEIEKLLTEATPGPWKAVAAGNECDDFNEVMSGNVSVADAEGANARFIAMAPDLAAEVVRLRKALEPFANAADALNDLVSGEISIGIFADGGMRFGPGFPSVKDLRAARAALEGRE